MITDKQFWLLMAVTLLLSMGFIKWAVLNSVTGDWLQASAQAGEVITGVVASLAVTSFIYQQRKDKTLSSREVTSLAIEQVAFFEEEILQRYENICEAIKLKDGAFDIKLMLAENIRHFSVEWMYANYPKSYSYQARLLPEKGEKLIDNRVLIGFLNKVELLSLRITHFDTLNHPSLICIKDSYVQIVESFAAHMLSIRIKNPNFYEATKIVYMKWKDEIDRTPLDALLEISKKKFLDEISKIENTALQKP